MIPKYRAWHIARKQMYPVIRIDFDDEDVMVRVKEKGWPDKMFEVYDFEDIILMQSTGLLLSKNNEFYADDILKLPTGVIGIVRYEGGAWWLNTDGIYLQPLRQVSDFTVFLGNIHEHPELLEPE